MTTSARFLSIGTTSARRLRRMSSSTPRRIAGYYVALNKTQSSRFILIDAHDHQSNEVYLIEADAPLTAMRQVAPREHGHEYQVEHHGERLIITTNSGGAVDFRICEAPVAAPGRENWREIEPHKPGRLIIDTVVFNRPHGASRARGQLAAHHGPQPRRRRRARHRLR